MDGLSPPIKEGELSLNKTINKIDELSERLERHGNMMRSRHQISTILTIVLGVSAPALVTLSITYSGIEWKILAIVITAFATASATIRSVLRFSERYSNSALTSLTLSHLEKQVQSQKAEYTIEVKEKFKQKKFFELASWADEELYKIKKNYVEQDVTAVTQDALKLSEPPKIESDEKNDPTKISSSQN